MSLGGLARRGCGAEITLRLLSQRQFPIHFRLPDSMYRTLDDDRIIETLERLRGRITERFPTSSLARVSEELLAIAHESASHVAYLARPSWPIRASVGVAILVMLVVLAAAGSKISVSTGGARWIDLVQGVEAAINDV